MSWIEDFLKNTEEYFEGPFKRRLEEIGKFLDDTFEQIGDSDSVKEGFLVFGRRLSILGKYIFNDKNFIVLGPRESGKTTLLEYLRTGQPIEKYNPTVGTVVIDRKFEIDEDFMKALKDVGGDKEFREIDWFHLIKSINPDGIIFMINGNESTSKIEESIDIAFENCLRHYSNGSRNLKAFYVFLNFYDKWKNDSSKKLLLVSKIKLKIMERINESSSLHNLKVEVYKTQLSPKGSPWNEVNSALIHFSKDI